MKLKNIFIGLAFIAILGACEKDEQAPVLKSTATVLKSIKYGDELQTIYEYNKKGFVVEDKSKFSYTHYNYNEKKQLISSELYVDERIYSSLYTNVLAVNNRDEWVNPNNTEMTNQIEYEYTNDGRLIKMITKRLHNNFSDYSTFEYNEQGLISKQTIYHENKISGYKQYTYDNRGNLKKETHYLVNSDTGKAELQTTKVLEYDDKFNPYKQLCKLPTPGKYTNTNNVIKETYTLHFEVSTDIEKVQVTENNYEYNTEGYPVKMNNIVEFVYL